MHLRLFLFQESFNKYQEEIKNFYKSETVPVVLENNYQTGVTTKIGGYTDLLEYLK